MNTLRVQVDGIGIWAPRLADYEALQCMFASGELGAEIAQPAASILSANERRRAPHSVLIAVEVAAQASRMSGRGNDVACVFASAFGDQATTDYMCEALAQTSVALSPTRFHNSVHNAAAGYWTIATHSQAPSSAICAGEASFGAGLLEACAQACADDRAVLFVCSDAVGSGPLGALTGSRRAFGCALMLSPATPHSSSQLVLALADAVAHHESLPDACAGWLQENPSAAALPLLAMLVRGEGRCVVAASDRLGLRIEMEKTA